MKKQKLDIRSTLKPKIDLPDQQPKQLDKIKKSINEIHITKKEEYFRTTIYLPKHIHTELKVFVAQHSNLTIKDFIIDAVTLKLNAEKEP